MRVVKELHELEHPLHEYLCGKGTDTSRSVHDPRRNFVHLWHARCETTVIVDNCTDAEAWAKVAEVRALIQAAENIAL